MKLHRDLGVTQKTAWYLAHRIRETWAKADGTPFAGPVEVDEATDGPTLQGFVRATDDAHTYLGMTNFQHEAVNHSVGEYVRGMAHTNGVESLWPMLKRGYRGTYSHMSRKHLGRYINEFAGRHNVRPRDTLNQMAGMTQAMVDKQLCYRDLVA